LGKSFLRITPIFGASNLFHEAVSDIETKYDLIDRLSRTLKQVYGMVENGFNHANILSDVDWRIMG
jgi:hypothetical protein